MTQRFSFNELTNIGNVADPELAQDAATKAYVDAKPSSLLTLSDFSTDFWRLVTESTSTNQAYIRSTRIDATSGELVITMSANVGTALTTQKLITYTPGTLLVPYPTTGTDQVLTVTSITGAEIRALPPAGVTINSGWTTVFNPISGTNNEAIGQLLYFKDTFTEQLNLNGGVYTTYYNPVTQKIHVASSAELRNRGGSSGFTNERGDGVELNYGEFSGINLRSGSSTLGATGTLLVQSPTAATQRTVLVMPPAQGSATQVLGVTSVSTIGTQQVTNLSWVENGLGGGLPFDVITWTNIGGVAYVSRIDTPSVNGVVVTTPSSLSGSWTISSLPPAYTNGSQIVLTDSAGRTVSGQYQSGQLIQANPDRSAGGGFAVSTIYTGFTVRLGKLASSALYVDNGVPTTFDLVAQLGFDTAGFNVEPDPANPGRYIVTNLGAAGNTIPYIPFVASATASAGQTFTDSRIGQYGGVASTAIVTSNGAVLTPTTDYTFSGNVMTVVRWLPALAVVAIEPAAAGNGGSGSGGVTAVTLTNTGSSNQLILRDTITLGTGPTQTTVPSNAFDVTQNIANIADIEINNRVGLNGADNFNNTGAVSNGSGFSGTGGGFAGTSVNIEQVDAVSYNNIRAALIGLGATPPAGASGSWTLPAYNLLIAAGGSPATNAQATITAVVSNSATNLTSITFTSSNRPYFANLMGTQSLWLARDRYTFITPVQTEVQRLADVEIASQSFVPAVASNTATWTNNIRGTTGSTINLLGGNGIVVNNNAGTPQFSVNGWAAGVGWRISMLWASIDIPENNVWTGNSAFPVFLTNGQVVARTGINSSSYLGIPFFGSGLSINDDLGAALICGQKYRDWHNSFPDALQITSVTSYGGSSVIIQTAPLAYGTNPAQDDQTVKNLFVINNPNAGGGTGVDYMLGTSYTGESSGEVYTRASGGGLNVVDTALRNTPTTVWNQPAWSSAITPIANSAIDARVTAGFINNARAGQIFIARRTTNTQYTPPATLFNGNYQNWVNTNNTVDVNTLPNFDTTSIAGCFRNTASYTRTFSVEVMMTFQGATSSINQCAMWTQIGDGSVVNPSGVKYNFTSKENLGSDAVIRTNSIVYVGPGQYFNTWFFCSQACNQNGASITPSNAVYGIAAEVQNRIVIREI